MSNFGLGSNFLKSIGSKIENAGQGIIDNYFKAGKSDSKLQRGRDPVLGSFRLQNRSRVNVGKQGTNSLGSFKFNDPKKIEGASTGSEYRVTDEVLSFDSFYSDLAGVNTIDDDSKNSKKFIKRQLEERSHLIFEFQTSEGSKKAFLPFFENLKISESQDANLADYSLLNRSSQIFSYMGAQSRVLKLSFSFKLLHILQLYSKDGGIDPRFFKHFLDFDTQTNTLKSFKGLDIVNPIPHAEIYRNHFKDISGNESYTNALFEKNYGLEKDGMIRSEQSILKVNKMINSIIYWINLVRSSVKNNSNNTVYGPPTIRLIHGPMYNAIPCITKNFNITIDENAGYDSETLFPRGIDVTMDLMETRVGDFSDFKVFDKIKGDNIVGWEAVFDQNNMDPYNGLINV